MEESKRVGVLFSGGLDSTYLIWKNLKDGNVVVPIYIEIENNRDKVKLEKNRIELLINKFRKEFTKDKIDFIRYPLSVNVMGNNVADLGQVPVWIMGLTYSQKYDIDELQIAYVMNDDAISYLNEISKIYRSFEVITTDSQPKLLPLKFPLTKTNKYIILDQLPEEYLELVVSCESPNITNDPNPNDNKLRHHDDIKPIEYKPCGYCEACKKLISVYNKNKIPDVYGEIIKGKSIDNLLRIREVERDIDENAHLMKIYIPYDNPTIFTKKEPKQLSFDFENSEVSKTEKWELSNE